MRRIIKRYFPKVLFILGILIIVGGKAIAVEIAQGQVQKAETIPILMYHSIGYVKNNELIMTPEKFRSQIKYLKDNGYNTLSLDELYNIFKNNKPIPRKSVVVTLDDGYSDNYKYAYPILKEFGTKATIFVITNTIDSDSSYLNSAQIKELQANGIDIESHTMMHEDLSILSCEEQLKTLKKSKLTLEDILGKQVNYIAYPFGRYNEYTVKAVKEAGYNMGFATGGKLAKKKNGLYSIQRRYINAVEDMSVFISKIKN